MSVDTDRDQGRDHDWIMAEAGRLAALGETAPRLARDPVNQPMINNWTEAIGDRNPIYADTEIARELYGGPVAPTAMAQVWTMYGLDPERPAHDPLHGTMRMLDEAGYTSVLGTNCDQTYARHLQPGEQVAVTTRLESVVGPKQTGVGEGYFVTTESRWWVALPDGRSEVVATMTFRVLKFRPRAAALAADLGEPVRPVVNRDTEFFWSGTAEGELRIQKCNACGVLRHPPGPVCPECHAMDRGYVVATGRGRVHSSVVHHAPKIPGKRLPLTLVLVELTEGVRMVGELLDPPETVEIGAPVVVDLVTVDDALTLPSWRLAEEGAR
ncbi:bifunctional MaoC family dehydratase N-terminal/OB-fold nucleic acid binding domain-containing protein [Nocardioides speluncae]|uniref:bifunctional MaoC family dehydratase N-terminal/OB-fold nucleic acid binding domain-containing protein n=1 Tax=Nocardioides speluncae TaxID=2670337 RepID=UPI00197CBABA|nr:MaoC family dehydratase N-terminal domain-containing protein [Nocardioides speluncae]